MILDGHIHATDNPIDKNIFLQRLKAAGIDGGVVLSIQPSSFNAFGEKKFTYAQRLDNLMSLTEISSNIFPFFWIDPMEEDALEQVNAAVARGVSGFKVICNHFYPGDERPMEVWRAIAKAKKPILFHSGIIYIETPSSKYNRPAEFEALFDIEGLKFSLAHVSWPWTDENIAVYGRFSCASHRFRASGGEMFIDITPGTPPIYRKEVLTKLFTVGYPIENNIVFGVDSTVDNYNTEYAKQWMERDNGIYQELNLSETAIEKIYSGNLKRFLGIS